jgi:hypothetical protein
MELGILYQTSRIIGQRGLKRVKQNMTVISERFAGTVDEGAEVGSSGGRRRREKKIRR